MTERSMKKLKTVIYLVVWICFLTFALVNNNKAVNKEKTFHFFHIDALGIYTQSSVNPNPIIKLKTYIS